MEGEEASNLMVDAIKYGFTNWTALLIGGLLFGVYVLLYLLLTIVPMALWYYGRETWAIVTLAVLAIPTLILTFFVAGYIVRCMRSVIRGNDVLPSPLEDIADTFKLGITGLLIYLPYIFLMMLPLLVLLVISWTALLAPDNVFVVLLFMTVLMAVSVVLAIVGFIFMLLVVNYAATGNFSESINPMTAIRLLRKNPFDFFVSLVVYYVVTLVFSLAAVTIVLYPWAFFLTVTALSFIMAKYFLRVSAPPAGA
jgi:hypothetical protein